MPSFKVDNYAVVMWSSKSIASAGAVVGIQLFEKRADSSGFNWRGYAYFFGDGVPVPPPAFESEFDLIALHYNLSLFAPMLQLLRSRSKTVPLPDASIPRPQSPQQPALANPCCTACPSHPPDSVAKMESAFGPQKNLSDSLLRNSL